MKSPTIRDVADRAGVGVGTVSRLLNGGHQVSPQTRARVQKAIEELGFRPSRRGQSFARGTTSNVIALVPFVTHPSAVERVSGMIHGLRESSLPVSVADVEVPEHQHEHLASMVDDLRPEGLVVVSLHLRDEELASLGRAGVRPVLVDAEAPGLTSLIVDDVAGGRMATEHLIGLGHERIAFVGDLERDPFGFTSSRRRHQGFVEALTSAGIERQPEFERTGTHSQDNARGQAAALFALPEPPSAVFAASDTQALGVLQAAREAGYGSRMTPLSSDSTTSRSQTSSASAPCASPWSTAAAGPPPSCSSRSPTWTDRPNGSSFGWSLSPGGPPDRPPQLDADAGVDSFPAGARPSGRREDGNDERNRSNRTEHARGRSPAAGGVRRGW